MYGVVVVVSRKTGQTSRCGCLKLHWSKFTNMIVSACKKKYRIAESNKKVNKNGAGVERVDLLRKMPKFCNPTTKGLSVKR